MVGGVTPGKGGTSIRRALPIFDTVAEAVDADRRQRDRHLRPAAVRRGRDSWKPPTRASTLVVCITEGIPVRGHGAA